MLEGRFCLPSIKKHCGKLLQGTLVFVDSSLIKTQQFELYATLGITFGLN
jgi:hypothetical protein